MAPNTYLGLFPRLHLVRSYTQNSKTTGRIYKDVLPMERLLYYRTYLFCWLELYVRHDRQLSYGSKHASQLFPMRYFAPTKHITRKLQVVFGRCTYRTTALLTEISIFRTCVRAGCKIISHLWVLA